MMDLRTGKTYETPEAAMADGVPESDIVDTRNGMPYTRERWPEPTANKPQGKRERERRLARMRALESR